MQFYFSAKQEHSSRLKQRADFLRILLKNRLGGKRGEIGPNSKLVAAAALYKSPVAHEFLFQVFIGIVTGALLADRQRSASAAARARPGLLRYM